MSVNSRYRNWFFTFSLEYHPDDCNEWNVIRDKIKNKKIRAAIISDIEVGDEANNYEHRHGIIQFENVMRFSTLKKMFPKAHIEVCKDVPAAIDYCTKKCTADACMIYEDNFKTERQRSDLKKIIEECKDIDQVIDEHPEEYCRYRKGLIDIMTRRNQDSDIANWLEEAHIQVDYFTGDSGSGKTHRAKEIGRAYMKDGVPVASVVFDNNGFASITGRRDCELLIINEFRDSCMKFHEFLGVLTLEDGVNVKGENKVFFKNCKRIIITSIIEPWCLYAKVNESKEQIRRRISTIYRFYRDEFDFKSKQIAWEEETEMKQEDPDY